MAPGGLAPSESLPRLLPSPDGTSSSSPETRRRGTTRSERQKNHRHSRNLPRQPPEEETEEEAESPRAPDEIPPGPHLRPDEGLLDAVLAECSRGPEASVEAIYGLLRTGENANARSASGMTPLAVAATRGCAPIVALLLECGAVVDAAVGDVTRAEVPLHLAARGGHRAVCHLLAGPTRERGMLDAENSTGWTPVHLATMGDHKEALLVLLRAGASVNVQNVPRVGSSPLHLAVHEGNAAMAELLCDRDADVNLADNLGRTVLHIAASRGDLALAIDLLAIRADPARRSREGAAPIDLVRQDHEDAHRLALLLGGAARPQEVKPANLDRFDIRVKADVL